MLCFVSMAAMEGIIQDPSQPHHDVKLFNDWSFDEAQVSILISCKLFDSWSYRCHYL